MSNVFTSLKKILELESQRGYWNDAVVGGLERYAEQWQSQAIAAVSGGEQIKRVEQITDALLGYALLPEGARRSTIRSIQERLDSLSKDATESIRKEKRKQEEARASKSDQAPHLRSQAPSFTISPLAAPLTSLTGIGPKLSGTLARLNLNEVGDLLWHLPYRYQDYSNLQPISDLKIGEEVTIRATVWGVRTRRIKGNRTLSTAVLIDGTGKINATFWNPHIDKYLLAEKTYFFSGKISSYMGKRTLESPEFEALSEDPTHTARIVPVYPLTEGLSSRVLRKHIRQVVDTWAEKLPDPLPADLRQRLGYPGIGDALQQVHFPDSVDALDKARKRLAFDELHRAVECMAAVFSRKS
jgi:ATP-dependent DNA helicase RecG